MTVSEITFLAVLAFYSFIWGRFQGFFFCQLTTSHLPKLRGENTSDALEAMEWFGTTLADLSSSQTSTPENLNSLG